MTDRDTMKQIAQNYKSGELIVLDAPVPACRPGGVLVQSLFSLISTGTEMMKVHEANLSMVGKARARPDQVRKVLDTVAQQGAMATYKKVMNKLDSYTPLGYSLCGVVVEVGAGAEEFKVGQLVAAAGNEFALHAEYNWIPVNLCAAVPRGVVPEHAAFSTVGAIAMQGVRRAEPQLGETSLVIGLGLIGQLVVRLLVAAGVRVVGLDMVEARCRLAEQAGAVTCAAPDDEGLAAVAASLDELTSGRGADHIFLAAGGTSNAPVETAAKLARDRARVVDIGKTKLDLPWNAYYDKELDVRFSRSYGPGRYDDRYELEGIDYPAGYVRWTERRNIECFLDLLARKDLEVETLVSGTFPMANAVSVYADLSSGALKAVGVLLSYPAPDPESLPRPAASLVRASVPSVPAGVTKTERPGVQAPGHRLHRRGQLRLLDAASPAGSAAGRRARPRQHDQVFVGGERPAAVRLHHRLDQRVGRAGGRIAGRDLRGDPARHPRRPGLPGAGDRQGGVRGEAARAERRGARPDHRDDCQDRQRPADGRLQPPLCPDAGQDEGRVRPGQLVGPGTWSTRARWPRTAGTATRARGPGSPARAVTSWTRSAGGPAAYPRRSTPSAAARTPTTSRSRCGSPTVPAA